MLFSLGHGQHVVQQSAITTTESAASRSAAVRADTEPLAAVAPGLVAKAAERSRALEMANGGAADAIGAGDAAMVSTEAPEPEFGKFRYLFPYGGSLPERPDMPACLDALADSMVEANATAAAQNSQIPPVFTYFGQFIDHDLTANTDRDSALSFIDGAITPAARSDVEANLVNLRTGSLGLDSLYGDDPGQGAFATKLANLMRFPTNTAKMRLALAAPVGGRVPLPSTDSATDLLRLGFLIRNGLLTVDELKALVPPELRNQFIDKATDQPILARAIIGDARNDENLIVAQLQVLFLRLHNKIADATGSHSFEKVRRLTRWHYQWLVVNSYLKTVCDPAIVDEVVDMEAPLYAAFFHKHGSAGPKMPMPLEFSVAAFRFGHSMIRGGYDHNRFFGAAVPGFDNVIPFASMSFLFGFTGDGRMNGDPALGQLPQNWVIEWDRWIKTDPAHPTRSARKIDTELAPPLADMPNQGNDPALGPDTRKLFKHLARRNLRRGYRLNLPTAQACIAEVKGAGYKPFPELTPEQLRAGSDARRDAIVAGGFDTATPLWFYLLREAEALADGEHLGPLGSHIVANTLVGLMVNDEDSYWNADGGPWGPAQFNPGSPIDSLEDMVRFCGML